MKKTNSYPTTVSISGRVRICLKMLLDQDIREKKIVDIGSSFGWLEKQIEKEGAKEVIGIEPAEDAVKFARSQTKAAKFLVGDALDTKLPKSHADIVISFDVIEHIPKNTESQMLKETNRILKPGGILLLSTPFNNFLSNLLDPAWYFGHRHYSKERLLFFLKQNNFKVLNFSTKGNIFSSLYLFWFYLMKAVTGNNNPRNKWIEYLDNKGYEEQDGITDIFLVAQKVK